MCTLHRKQNALTVQRLQAEAYVREAVQEGAPEQVVDVADVCSEGARLAVPQGAAMSACLAPECLGQDGASSPNCLAWADDPGAWDRLADHPLCPELAASLRERGLLWHSYV